MIKMKALDTMHLSSVQAANLVEGDVFEIAEQDAKTLESRGLAKRYSGADKPMNQVAEVSEPNKQAAAIKDAQDNATTDLNAEAKKAIVSTSSAPMKSEAAPAKSRAK